ncbi:hypothetical protein MY520_27835, partial [Geodermatophilus sp. CPCC 205506]
MTGAFLGIVLLPPTAAGVLGLGGTSAPPGQEQVEAEGQEVVADGSPATPDAPAPAPAPAPSTPISGSGAGGGGGRAPVADPDTVLPSAGLAGARAGRVTPAATRTTSATGRSAPAPAGALPGTRATAGEVGS